MEIISGDSHWQIGLALTEARCTLSLRHIPVSSNAAKIKLYGWTSHNTPSQSAFFRRQDGSQSVQCYFRW
ncbi:hypothetical protein I7I48_01302 [Histoplasma ohiense]|nr:hypothetical protein I7I48_01302 [Histoplasma ohiense (nom. inval.)]